MILPAGDVSDERQASRRLFVRHAALTLAMLGPLMLAFIRADEYYPVVVYKMFYGTSSLESGRGHQYYVFRGETLSGRTLDIAPITIVDALDDKIWSMVSQVVHNESFRLRSPHPGNVQLMTALGGIDYVPDAARLPDLLHAWGSLYNARLPAGSSQRLKRVRLDVYHWPQAAYADYANYVRSWIVEL